MSAQSNDETWLPLMEYAVRKNLSLSTLRRYIKAGKVTFRLEAGRYLIFDRDGEPASEPVVRVHHPFAASHAPEEFDETELLRSKVARLEHELKRAREEVAELKTLIACYEERPASAQLEV